MLAKQVAAGLLQKTRNDLSLCPQKKLRKNKSYGNHDNSFVSNLIRLSLVVSCNCLILAVNTQHSATNQCRVTLSTNQSIKLTMNLCL